MKVYVVCEYAHGVEDDIHSIRLVTSDRDEAKRLDDGITYYVEEYEVDAVIV